MNVDESMFAESSIIPSPSVNGHVFGKKAYKVDKLLIPGQSFFSEVASQQCSKTSSAAVRTFLLGYELQ